LRELQGLLWPSSLLALLALLALLLLAAHPLLTQWQRCTQLCLMTRLPGS
jgi:hypothetical protein